METACTYCGSDIERHDPLYVNAGENDGENRVGQFCNYGCLHAHIEAESLATGAACEWSP